MSSESETINQQQDQPHIQQEEEHKSTPLNNNFKQNEQGQSQQKEQKEQKQQSSADKFSCRICFEIADEPVITTCGHLYCWHCIYQWSQQKKPELLCPICSNKIDLNKCTSIFTGEEKSSTNRQIPRRPQPERTEPTNNNQGQNGWNGAEFNFQAFGFPFFFNGFQFNWNAGGGAFPQQNFAQNNNNNQAQQPRTWKQTMWQWLSILLFIFFIIGPSNFFGWSSDYDYDNYDYNNYYSSNSYSSQRRKKKNQQTKKNSQQQYYNYNSGRNPQYDTKRVQQSNSFDLIDHFSDYSMYYYIGFVLLMIYLPKILQKFRRQ